MGFSRVVIDWTTARVCRPGEVMTDMPFPLYAPGLYEVSCGTASPLLSTALFKCSRCTCLCRSLLHPPPLLLGRGRRCHRPWASLAHPVPPRKSVKCAGSSTLHTFYYCPVLFKRCCEKIILRINLQVLQCLCRVVSCAWQQLMSTYTPPSWAIFLSAKGALDSFPPSFASTLCCCGSIYWPHLGDVYTG
jgi:hypothetical protein